MKVIEVIVIMRFYYLRYKIFFLLICARARARLNVKLWYYTRRKFFRILL